MSIEIDIRNRKTTTQEIQSIGRMSVRGMEIEIKVIKVRQLATIQKNRGNKFAIKIEYESECTFKSLAKNIIVLDRINQSK